MLLPPIQVHSLAVELVITIDADPDFVVSCVDVAVMVAVPTPAGVRTPALLTVPMLVGLTDHLTDEL